jgi:uncharacterized protein YegP (UPF0339 family)
MRVLLCVLALALCASAAPITPKEQNGSVIKRKAFTITERNSKFHFNVQAENKEIILSSQMYQTAADARKGIVAVLAVGANKDNIKKEESKPNPDGKTSPYFTIKADNEKTIGVSEMYSGTGARQTGADAVVDAVNDVTLSIAEKLQIADASKGSSGGKNSIRCFKNSKGEFWFVLVGGKGEKVAKSEMYKTKDALFGGVAAVLRSCGQAKQLEAKPSADKQFFVHCKANGNNAILVNTENYTRGKTAKDAIKIVQSLVREVLKDYVKENSAVVKK